MATETMQRAGRIGVWRWIVCALLFGVTTLNYMDRQVIGLLKPTLERELGWNEIDYSNIIFAFTAAYAVGFPLAGRGMDRWGVRAGLGLAVMMWSLAIGLHALTGSVLGFCVVRANLGLAEGGNFPAAIKAVGEWFPRRERALAAGLFNAGSNAGAILCPLIVSRLALRFGWRTSFVVLAAAGLLWVPLWLILYRRPDRHPWVSEAERRHIAGDPPEPAIPPVPWLRLLRHRQTWAFAAGMFVTAPIWWFFIYWIPDVLNKTQHLDLAGLAWPLVAIFALSSAGSVGGGWLSSALIRRGWTVNASRKTALLVCALCVTPVFAVCRLSDLRLVVLLMGLAGAAHCGFAANLFTIVSDTVPRHAVGSVVGIGGMAGALGGMGVAKATGYILEWTHSYELIFAWASVGYLVALALMHVLLPRLEFMTVPEEAPAPLRGNVRPVEARP